MSSSVSSTSSGRRQMGERGGSATTMGGGGSRNGTTQQQQKQPQPHGALPRQEEEESRPQYSQLKKGLDLELQVLRLLIERSRTAHHRSLFHRRLTMVQTCILRKHHVDDMPAILEHVERARRQLETEREKKKRNRSTTTELLERQERRSNKKRKKQSSPLLANASSNDAGTSEVTAAGATTSDGKKTKTPPITTSRSETSKTAQQRQSRRLPREVKQSKRAPLPTNNHAAGGLALLLPDQVAWLREATYVGLPEVLSRISHAADAIMYGDASRGFFLPMHTVILACVARVRTFVLLLGRLAVEELVKIDTLVRDVLYFPSSWGLDVVEAARDGEMPKKEAEEEAGQALESMCGAGGSRRMIVDDDKKPSWWLKKFGNLRIVPRVCDGVRIGDVEQFMDDDKDVATTLRGKATSRETATPGGEGGEGREKKKAAATTFECGISSTSSGSEVVGKQADDNDMEVRRDGDDGREIIPSVDFDDEDDGGMQNAERTQSRDIEIEQNSPSRAMRSSPKTITRLTENKGDGSDVGVSVHHSGGGSRSHGDDDHEESTRAYNERGSSNKMMISPNEMDPNSKSIGAAAAAMLGMGATKRGRTEPVARKKREKEQLSSSSQKPRKERSIDRSGIAISNSSSGSGKKKKRKKDGKRRRSKDDDGGKNSAVIDDIFNGLL